MDLTGLLKKLFKYIFNEDYRFEANCFRGRYDAMPDEEYVSRLFKARFGKMPDLKNPQTLNEKMQWIKLYDRRPEYTMMADKCAVRDYIAEQIGEEYLIPQLGVWEKPEDIDFEALPDQFVLKCNHNSGKGMCICKDKSKLDIEKTKEQLREGLKENFYLVFREWPYKNIPPKIVGEEFLSDGTGQDLMDYKFMCFNGEVKYSFVCSERFSPTGVKVTFLDRDWKVLPFEIEVPRSSVPIPKPRNYEKMIELAEKLAKGIPHIRVDFYECNGKVYFGELTFFTGAGMVPFQPAEWDYKLGQLLTLPEKAEVKC